MLEMSRKYMVYDWGEDYSGRVSICRKGVNCKKQLEEVEVIEDSPQKVRKIGCALRGPSVRWNNILTSFL